MMCVNGVEKKNCYDVNEVHSVHWGINPPPPSPLKNTNPSILPSPPSNLQTVQAPFFRQSLPLYWFFMNSPPLP